MAEGVTAPRYRQDLTRISLEDGTATVLYRPAEMLQGADWSPDGQRIAVVVAGATDTLLILDPNGAEVARLAFSDYRSVSLPSWCEDSKHLVLMAAGFRPGIGLLVNTDTGSTREFGGELLAIGIPLCLGTARGAAFYGLTEAGRWLYVHDFLRDSLLTVLESPSPDPSAPQWLPDEVEAPVWRVGIAGGDREVRWGATQPPRSPRVPDRWEGSPGAGFLDKLR